MAPPPPSTPCPEGAASLEETGSSRAPSPCPGRKLGPPAKGSEQDVSLLVLRTERNVSATGGCVAAGRTTLASCELTGDGGVTARSSRTPVPGGGAAGRQGEGAARIGLESDFPASVRSARPGRPRREEHIHLQTVSVHLRHVCVWTRVCASACARVPTACNAHLPTSEGPQAAGG